MKSCGLLQVRGQGGWVRDRGGGGYGGVYDQVLPSVELLHVEFFLCQRFVPLVLLHLPSGVRTRLGWDPRLG